MAWTATETFDGYTIGNNLSGLSGGSGWSGNWVEESGESGEFTIQTAPTGGTGLALRIRNTNTAILDDVVSRSISGVSAGSVTVRMRINTAAPGGDMDVRLSESGTYRMYVKFYSTGNILIYNDDVAGYDIIQAFSVDTWYTIDIEFDDAAQPNKYRARIDGGTWTGWKGALGGYSTINKISFLNATSASPDADLWVDSIVPTPAAGPPPETRTITIVRGG